MFFNLCDGAWDEDRAGKEVIEALEAFGVPFTGADSVFYEPSKVYMKMLAYYQGVATPNYVLAQDASDIEVWGMYGWGASGFSPVAQVEVVGVGFCGKHSAQCTQAHKHTQPSHPQPPHTSQHLIHHSQAAVAQLQFPIIVKHPSGYSSVGMHEGSRCTTPDSLRVEAGHILAAAGSVLIEEFIEGVTRVFTHTRPCTHMFLHTNVLAAHLLFMYTHPVVVPTSLIHTACLTTHPHTCCPPRPPKEYPPPHPTQDVC